MPGSPPARREAVVQHRLARFCAAQGLDVALRPELVEAFVAGACPDGQPRPRAPTARCCARSGAQAGRRGPRLLAALAPKRPTAPKKEQTLVGGRLSALGVAARVGAHIIGAWHRGRAASRRAGGCRRRRRDGRARGRDRPGGHRPDRPRRVPFTPKPWPSKQNRPVRATCSARAGRTGPTATSSTTSATGQGRPGWPEAFFWALPVQFHLRPLGGRHPCGGTALFSRHRRGRGAAALRPSRPGGTKVQGRAAESVQVQLSQGRALPGPCSALRTKRFVFVPMSSTVRGWQANRGSPG